MANSGEKATGWFYWAGGCGSYAAHIIEFDREVSLKGMKKHLVRERGFTVKTVERLQVWSANDARSNVEPQRQRNTA